MKDTIAFLRKNQATFLPFAILVFLALATFLTLILTKQRQDIRPKAILSDNGQLTFANLSKTSANNTGTDNFSVAVNMNGGGQNVVGADILVSFDKNKLTLLPANDPGTPGIVQNTLAANPYKTYAPVDAAGAFDRQRVINCANSGGANCPSGAGVIEFGIVSFDWSGNALTTPTTALSPVVTLNFQVKAGAATGPTTLGFVNNGVTATTDSNIVVNPSSGGDPEDILQAPGYANSTVDITIVGISPTPTPSATPGVTPRPSPSATPGPSATPDTCVPASQTGCFDLTGNGTINVQDITQVVNRYGTAPGDALYTIKHNLNCDTVINIIDVTLLANRYNLSSCTRQ